LLTWAAEFIPASSSVVDAGSVASPWRHAL
jgi:hypothetical protein